MYPPRGFTSARTRSVKTRIWIQPLRVMTGVPSEPLRAEQGVGEVDEQAQGHETAECIVEEHDAISSEPVTGDGVADREREKGKASGDHDQVEHGSLRVGDKNPHSPEAYRACIQAHGLIPSRSLVDSWGGFSGGPRYDS